jgi:hypothetical protein
MQKSLFILFLFFLPQTLLSQSDTPLRITASFSSLVSDEVPFWMDHNRFGVYSREANQQLFRIKTEFDGKTGLFSDDLTWFSGIELAGRTGGSFNERPVHQLYGGLKYNNWEFYAGAREERIGTVYRPLSAGPTIWSGNAKPMYKVKLQLAEFTPVPYTDGWFQVKGAYSHGWFEETRQVQKVYLHEKYVYGRLGKEGLPMIYGGLMHQGMWGGYDPVSDLKIPSGFDDYLRIVLGKEGDADSPSTFQINKFGNSLGAWEWGLMLNRPKWDLLLNKSTIFEDGSGLWIRSIEDGIQGASIVWHYEGRHTARKTAFTWEFWHTKSQSGPGASDPPPGWVGDRDADGNPFGGRDNYFNHGVYRNGWSYHGRTIGTPLITYNPETGRMVNNRVVAQHFGLMHTEQNWNAKILYTWSNNHGTYSNPYPEPLKQNYFLASFERHFGEVTDIPFTIRIETGIDKGEFTGDRFGVLLSLMLYP